MSSTAKTTTSLKFIEKSASIEPPAIAIFPNGIPTEIAEKDDFPFQYLKHSDIRKQDRGFIFAETSQTRFLGSNCGTDAISQSTNNFAIGVFRPNKNSSTKIIDAHGLFSMKQVKFDDITGLDTETITEVDFNTMRTELTERFGSRKRRRELRSMENNKFCVESNESALLAVDTVMQAVDNMADSLADDGFKATQNNLLPTYDASATEPEHIYPFSSFLPKSLWENLNVKSIIKPTETEDELRRSYPGYVLNRRSRFNGLSGEDAKIHARSLIFMTYLMRLLQIHKPRNIADAIQCPPPIGEYLKKTYFPNNENGKESKAKLLVHIAILAVNTSVGHTIEESSLKEIAIDCRQAVSQILPYFAQAGCRASKDKCKLTAPLKLPQFQSNVGGGKRRR